MSLKEKSGKQLLKEILAQLLVLNAQVERLNQTTESLTNELRTYFAEKRFPKGTLTL